MRAADQHERSLFIHEAAHIWAARINKWEFKSVKVIRKGRRLEGKIDVTFPTLPSKDYQRKTDEEYLDARVNYHKCLIIYAVGYLAEMLYMGSRAFFRNNPNLMASPEMEGIIELARVLNKKEIKKTLLHINELISNPETWATIIAMAEDVQRYRTIIGWPGSLFNTIDEIEPEHDGKPLIDFIMKEIGNGQKK